MTDERGGPGGPPPGWYPDPSGRYELRYYDGSTWTAHVSTAGTQSYDEPQAVPAYGVSSRSYPSAAPQQAWSSAGAGFTGGVTSGSAPTRVDLPGAVRVAFQKYADFSGRASRSEYWWFALAVFLAYFLLGLFTSGMDDPGAAEALFGLLALGAFLPSLAVSVRRLHDTDRSGWTLLLGIIPLVGPIILVVTMASEGLPRPNRWGPPLV